MSDNFDLKSAIFRVAEEMNIQCDDSLESSLSGMLGQTDPHVDCLLLKGDNLTALGRLSSAYYEKIDFCYIDPPYNTGQEFIYSDNKRKAQKGIWGRHHDWLAFMLPRLVAVHALLKPDGVIAISIDDYEYAHLKILADHIFEPENYIATLVVCRSKNGKGSKAHVAVNHEYVLLYGKTSDATVGGVSEGAHRVYDKSDSYGDYKLDGLFRKKGDASLKEDRPSMYYPLYFAETGEVFAEKVNEHLQEVYPVDSQGVHRRWLWGLDKAKSESWKLYASKKGVVYVKNYNSENKKVKLRSLLDKPEYLTDRATSEIKEIFGEKVFETPKPLNLIKDLVACCSPKDGLILDFFAGSGTTAEAVHVLNREEGGQRKTILVEQDTPVKKEHIAFKQGFSKICDLTEFRVRAIAARDPLYKMEAIFLQNDNDHSSRDRQQMLDLRPV